MAQLRQDYPLFVANNTEVIVIGPEDRNRFNKYWQENQLQFIGIPDPSHRILKKYGQEINLFKFGRMPAQLIIDKNGTVRYVHYGHSMSDIPSNNELLALIDEINQ